MSHFETKVAIARNNAGEWAPTAPVYAEEFLPVSGAVAMVGDEWVVSNLSVDLERFAAFEADAIRDSAEALLVLAAER